MAYGERWVNEALYGGCDDLADLTILPACPPQGDEARYFRTLRHAGIVDGPTPSPVGRLPSCLIQNVAFQMVSEMPDLLAPANVLTEASVSSAASLSAEATTNEWLGDAAVVVRIAATTDLADWTIRAVPMAAGQSCPAVGADPCASYTLGALPAGHSITIDPTVREVIEWDATGKRYVSGLARLSFDPVFDWIEVPPCSKVCVTVTSVTGTADVTITQFDREL